MVRGTTSKGFEFCFEEEKLDDMRFVDALAEMEENPLRLSTVLGFLVEKGERKKLYDLYKTEDGRVPTESIVEAITEMMETTPETKN